MLKMTVIYRRYTYRHIHTLILHGIHPA